MMLTGLLTGKAMAAYTTLQADESGNYDKVKKAILCHYDVNKDTHRG